MADCSVDRKVVLMAEMRVALTVVWLVDKMALKLVGLRVGLMVAKWVGQWVLLSADK